MDLDFVSVHKNAKRELSQYPAILTSRLVNNIYVMFILLVSLFLFLFLALVLFAFVLFHWKLFDIQVKGCLSGSVEGVKSNINDDNNKKVVIIMIRKRILIIYATSGKSVQLLL